MMDVLRSCYSSYMRPFRDRPDILVPGRWHFCPVGAEPLPFWHVFGSSIWDIGPFPDQPPVGEVTPTVGWYRGTQIPGLDGRHHCGEPDVWQRGALWADRGALDVDPIGRPICCSPPPQLAEGEAHGGESQQWTWTRQTGTGGEAHGGISEQWTAYASVDTACCGAGISGTLRVTFARGLPAVPFGAIDAVYDPDNVQAGSATGTWYGAGTLDYGAPWGEHDFEVRGWCNDATAIMLWQVQVDGGGWGFALEGFEAQTCGPPYLQAIGTYPYPPGTNDVSAAVGEVP